MAEARAQAAKNRAAPPLLFNTEATIRELEDETDAISPSSLSPSEQTEYKGFGEAHQAAQRQVPTFGSYLSGEDARSRCKKTLKAVGASRESKGGCRLASSEMERFARLGVVGPFPSNLAVGNRNALRADCEDNAQVFAHLQHPALLSLAMRSEITERVASLLGDEVDCVRSSIFVKRPGQSNVTQWHMAMSSNFGADDTLENDFVSVWVALTDVPREMGCLKLIPGSFRIYPAGLMQKMVRRELGFDEPFDAFFAHKLLQSFQLEDLSSVENKTPLQRFLAERTNAANVVQRVLRSGGYLKRRLREDAMSAVALEAKAGEFYIFSSENFHGSVPHTSTRTRVAVAFRFARADLAMTRTDNMKTLIDRLPEGLRAPLVAPGGYRLPAVRVHGQIGLSGPQEGNKHYFAAPDLASVEVPR